MSGIVNSKKVSITSYKFTSQRLEVFENYGSPDVIIDGNEILTKEGAFSDGLFNVLNFNFRDKLLVKRNKPNYAKSMRYYSSGGKSGAMIIGDGRSFDLMDGLVEEEIRPDFMVKSVQTGPGYETFYVIDGKPVLNFEYNVLPFLSAKEIVSLELIEFAENIKDLYVEVNVTVPPPGFLNGAVLAIYTRAGTGLHGALIPNYTQRYSAKLIY
jgi:hypothetical protein